MTEPRRTLALFGASGATGRRIVVAALAEGFRVQALVRPNAAISSAPGDLVQITGSLDDAAALRATLGGAGAAAVVFGPRAPYTEVFCAEGTRRIVEAMQRAGIRRLICQTGAMVGDYPHNLTAPFRWLARLNRWRAPAAAADRRRQEEVVMRSGLDWTLVKPPRLTDGAAGSSFRAGAHLRVGLTSSASRAGVAALVIQELVSPKHVGETVFVVSAG